MDVDDLLSQVSKEIHLEKISGNIRIVSTSPANFKEREDIELANKYHKLFNKAHTIQDISNDKLEERFKELTKDTIINKKEEKEEEIKEKRIKKNKNHKEERKQNPELLQLWKDFNLSDISSNEEEYSINDSEDNEEFDDFDEYFLEDEESLLNVIKSCI